MADMGSYLRQRTASEACTAAVGQSGATSADENVHTQGVRSFEDAGDCKAPGTSMKYGTSRVESDSPAKVDKEESVVRQTRVNAEKTTSVADLFCQYTSPTSKQGKEQREKEKSWDKQKHVKLVCAEGTAIFVKREVAEECDLFRRMLATSERGETSFSEGRKAEINLPTIRRRILEKTVEYLQFRHNWYQDGGHSGLFQVESDIALELLFAANYLGLSDGDAQTVKSPDLC